MRVVIKGGVTNGQKKDWYWIEIENINTKS